MSARPDLGLRRRYPRFRVNERVAMTEYALAQGLQGHAASKYGIVRAQPYRLSVIVQRDGLKSLDRYHAAFWRHLRKMERP